MLIAVDEGKLGEFRGKPLSEISICGMLPVAFSLDCFSRGKN